MALLSSIFRTRSAEVTAEPVLTWRKNDFLTYTVGHDEQAVLLRGRHPLVLPGFIVDFVNSCAKFEPLEAHLEDYADKHAWGELERDAVRSWIPRLQEEKLLVSSSDTLAACQRATAGHAPTTIATLGFPTGGDRVDLVERGLHSFAANAQRHGRDVEFLIADSSIRLEHREAFRRRLREVAKELGVVIRYSGEEERRRFADELMRRGADPEAVEFALFDPLKIGFACGANRNALLLDQVGRAFCSIDDDAVCHLTAAPSSSARLRVFSQCDPFSRWLFPDRASAIAHTPEVDVDFLASHEALLGHAVGSLSESLRPEEFDVSEAADDFLRRIGAGDGRVRATFSGHLGDPGIPTSVYFLYFEGENRQRLTSSEAAYREAFGSRNVFVVSPCSAVGDSSTSPGMAMGLDHRELLPPFFPVLHAEDFVYGATLWQTVNHSFLGHVPIAIRHEPRPGKSLLQPNELNADHRAVVFEFAHLIRRVILRFTGSESASTEDRLRMLGRFLRSIGEQPLPDFIETIRGHILEHESGKIDHLETEMRADTETPDFWREDVEAYVAHVREALTHDDFDIPFDLKPDRSNDANRALMRELFARYGRLLEAWPSIVAIARDVHGAGFESTMNLLAS